MRRGGGVQGINTAATLWATVSMGLAIGGGFYRLALLLLVTVLIIQVPLRWVVERSFAWAARFRRLARDYERLLETLAGLHFLAFAMLMLKQFFAILAQSP
jgi:uncharacterized membrane protein YhiD involved in acid resistance